MKIAILWYWEKAEEIYPYWRDGLRGAIEHIGKNHEVDMYLGEVEPEGTYDAIIFWGDSNCPFFDKLDKYTCKKGIFLTTDPHNIENLRKLDVVYCESTPIYEKVRSAGIHAVKAFGTDTDFFSPDNTIEKDIEYFYPATFSPWKRQSELAYLGDKLWCVGTLQPDGQREYDAVEKAGAHIAEGYFKAEYIRDLYRRTKRISIPAIHGSERTVLEAMSCDILPKITCLDNIRSRSYIAEYNNSEYKTPRGFILNNYSHSLYAESILKGIV